MPDFLLELRSEEIPARMQARARADLEKLFVAELTAAGLTPGAITTYATPRRLALIAQDLPDATEAVSEELKGPPEGAPDAAIEGFCRKAGLRRDQLTLRDVKGRNTWFAVIDKPGRATAEVLAEAIPAVIRAFPWPKSMRWGDASVSTESLRWVRPLQGIVALLGEDVVPCEVAGVAGASPAKVGTGFASGDATTIKSGAATVGHRFHHPGAITIGSAADYVEKLRACHVIVDQDERAATIALGAKMAAKRAGLDLVEDEALLAENAGLTEFPVPLLGSFDPKLLDAPREILELTLKVNQKYFSLRQANGEMAPNFVCVANIDAADGGEKIVEGNRKVAEARLSDAIFFWEQDLKVPLAEQAKKLDRIVFHEKLGTVADKAARVAQLAHWLIDEGIVPVPEGADRTHYASMAQKAGALAKADLVTQTVGEFPEVQGIIGYELAMSEDQPIEVARAIRDHYKPVGQGDEVPTEPVSVAVALADKLDTLIAFDLVDEVPSGSRDPFAIRRQAISIITLVLTNSVRLPTIKAVEEVWKHIVLQMFTRSVSAPEPNFLSINQLALQAGGKLVERKEGTDAVFLLGDQVVGRFSEEKDSQFSVFRTVIRRVFSDPVNRSFERMNVDGRAVNFIADRLKVQQREAGVRHDLIDAVFALGGEDDLVRLLARVHALQAFVETDEGANLLAGYKRAANILKKEGYEAASTSRHPGPVPGSAAQQVAASDADTQAPEQVRGDDAGGADGVTGAAALSAEGARQPPYTPEPAEAALIAALDAAEPRAAAAIEAEDFEGAMAALASLRAPIDAFFDDVTVNDSDPDKRAARLALLARMRDAVHRVADFSRIEG